MRDSGLLFIIISFRDDFNFEMSTEYNDLSLFQMAMVLFYYNFKNR